MFVYRVYHILVDRESIPLTQLPDPLLLEILLIVGHHEGVHVGCLFRGLEFLAIDGVEGEVLVGLGLFAGLEDQSVDGLVITFDEYTFLYAYAQDAVIVECGAQPLSPFVKGQPFTAFFTAAMSALVRV